MVRRACSVLALCLRTGLRLPWFWPIHPQAGVPGADGDLGGSDRKRSRRQPYSRTYRVAINFAVKIPMRAIANALRGQDSEHFQEAVRVLDIMLRQNAAQKVFWVSVRSLDLAFLPAMRKSEGRNYNGNANDGKNKRWKH